MGDLIIGGLSIGGVGMGKVTVNKTTEVETPTSDKSEQRTMPDGRVNPADVRKGFVSMRDVLSDVQALRGILAYIEVTANLAIERGVEQLETDGVTQLGSAQRSLSTASAHLAKAYLRDVIQRASSSASQQPEGEKN